MRKLLVTLFTLVMLLAACGGSDSDETISEPPTTAPITEPVPTADAPTADPTEPPSTEPSPTAETPNPDDDPNESTPTAETPDPDGDDDVGSVYTEIDFEACDVVESFAESGGSIRQCEGYADTALYVSEGDGRFDIDAGIRNDDFLTGGRAFNSIGETVEWRLQDGEPIAVIARFDFDDGSGIDSSELAVITVGTPSAPGCVVQWVAPDAQPDQNTAARRIADDRAADFPCVQDPDGPELPSAVLGRFAPDADECAMNVSLSEVIVGQEQLDFYYGYSVIRSITPVDDGYRLETTLYQLEGAVEIVPEPATYTIATAPDGIVFDYVPTQQPPEMLVRCEDDGADDGSAIDPDLTTTTPVDFEPGADAAQVDGTISGFEIDDYTIEATAGQRVTAGLVSDGPAVVLVIEESIGSDGSVDQLAFETSEPLEDDDAAQTGWTWSGDIPQDGTYRVRVIHSGVAANDGTTSDYDLVIEITS